jgi:hypothetical protein
MNFRRLPLPTGSTPWARSVSLGRQLLAALALTVSVAGVAQAQGYANLTVGGAFAPGVFGQISLGNNPPPPVWNTQPVTYGRPVYGAPVMYLHVSQEEYRHWGRYCARYRACGRPVHFVRVERSNPWWARHGYYGSGPSHYRQAQDHWARSHDRRRYEPHRGYRDAHVDNPNDPRHESRRGER